MEANEEDEGEEHVICNEGTYVRVYAQVRTFQVFALFYSVASVL